MPACCSIQRAAVCSLSQKVSALIWVEELQPVLYSMWSCWRWVFLRAQAMCGVFKTPGMKWKWIPSLGALSWEKCDAVHRTAEILGNFAVHRPRCCEVCIANYSVWNAPSCAVLCWFIPPKDAPLGGKQYGVHFCSGWFALLHAPLRPALGTQCPQVTAQTRAFSDPYLSSFKNTWLFGKWAHL